MLKLEDFILTFWPGIFSIFYGDEVGIQGYGNLANVDKSDFEYIIDELIENLQEQIYIPLQEGFCL
mgnify:CR=1 FL=1